MKTDIVVHADDFGLCPEITQAILACVDGGSVGSVSVICNTPYFGEAMQLLKAQPGRCVARLHLNLVEGEPVSHNVPALTDASGQFRHSFAGLWWRYTWSGRTGKKQLAEQVAVELAAQIDKYLAASPDAAVAVDSHTHVHMIPFVFRELLRLTETRPVSFIRLPRERFYLSLRSWRHYCSLNIVKHLLLNRLSRSAQASLMAADIGYNTYFIGVLGTGSMTADSIEAGIKALRGKEGSSVEILLHPGGVANAGRINWPTQPEFARYYTAPQRCREAALAKSDQLKKILSATL